ncbi:MAG: shikimate dehydrogenase [Bacteroidetes bacterium]|nr:MAG: shikimate dehydrogenase [Bacteroidota bacterium]
MKKHTYIIGEIGQNHNGSADIAKLIIDLASRKPKDDLFGRDLQAMDAVKLTKRDLRCELTNSAMQKPYDSPHSFGKTYGEHRAHLELSNEEHYECYKHAKEKGLDFVETLCAIGCLDLLKLFTPDRLKVASRDLTNIPLLEAMAETKIPMILSTGMANKEDLDRALNSVTRYHSHISILHCLSEYPAQYHNINLNTIRYLKEHYGAYTIGYSDHSVGIMMPTAAVAMGAEIIEKHITIDRELKGTDQRGSLAPNGIFRMVRDIRILELSMGEEKLFRSNDIEATRKKLERSIASKRTIKKGEIITLKDLHLLSPGNGYRWAEKEEVIGKEAVIEIPENELILTKHIR